MPPANGRAVRAILGFGLVYPARDRPCSAEATVPGGGYPPLLLRHGLGGSPFKPKIANSELLTAENPTV